jgi:hypothetical protein
MIGIFEKDFIFRKFKCKVAISLIFSLNFYVPESYIMYLSDFCRFYYVGTCGWERRGDMGGLEKGGG